MNGDSRIERARLGAARVTGVAEHLARFGGRKIGEPEGMCRGLVAHDVVGGVGGTGAVAGLAADLDGGDAGGSLAGAVTREAPRFWLAGDSSRGLLLNVGAHFS